MRNRSDGAVAGILGAAILTCIIAAVAIQPTPLSSADAQRWIRIASGGSSSAHLPHQTFSLDEVAVGPMRAPYTDQRVTVPRGASLAVTGWALDPQLRASSRVIFRIDRGPWHPTRDHLPRPDVAKAFELPNAVNSGFTASVMVASLAPGVHQLELATVGLRMEPIPEKVGFTVARH